MRRNKTNKVVDVKIEIKKIYRKIDNELPQSINIYVNE